MTYYLGFDGGGTKTECVLLDQGGQLLSRGLGGPSNAVRIGFGKAFAGLTEAANAALSAAGVDARQITAVCAGLAGAGRSRVVKRMMTFLVEAFPQALVYVTSDFEIALETAVGDAPGVVLIAGTGSAAYGRNAAGHTLRAGGQGPWIGDEGSAYDIGRRAVMAVARARDALEPVTLLADLIPIALQCPTWESLTQRISEAPDQVFPRIFPIVLEAAAANDPPARDILLRAAYRLSRLAGSVIQRLGMTNDEFVLAKSGGVFGHNDELDRALDALLASNAPRAKIILLSEQPAMGAARMGIRLFGAGRSERTPAQTEAVHGGKG
jgi:N-acetylglucosamine kinase-like BadF-type ATPase